eukprot:3794297-Heterocapsa_arctica.AAC.1
MCCKSTGLMLADKGELAPKLSITKKVLVNWLRQNEGGIPDDIYERWEQYAVLAYREGQSIISGGK